MIVQQSFTDSYRKCRVSWVSSEVVRGVRRSYVVKVIKDKEFMSFAAANGFSLGLQKKGCYVYPVQYL